MSAVLRLFQSDAENASLGSFYRAVAVASEARGWPIVPEALAKFAAAEPGLQGILNALNVFGYRADITTLSLEGLAAAELPAVAMTAQGSALVFLSKEQINGEYHYAMQRVTDEGQALPVVLSDSRLATLAGSLLMTLLRVKPAAPGSQVAAAKVAAPVHRPSAVVTPLRPKHTIAAATTVAALARAEAVTGSAPGEVNSATPAAPAPAAVIRRNDVVTSDSLVAPALPAAVAPQVDAEVATPAAAALPSSPTPTTAPAPAADAAPDAAQTRSSDFVDTVRAAASDASSGETDKLCRSLARITELLGQPLPPEAFAENAVRRSDDRVDVRDVLHNLEAQGFQAKILNCPIDAIPDEAFPVVLFRKNGDTLVAHSRIALEAVKGKNKTKGKAKDSSRSYEVWRPELDTVTVSSGAALAEELDEACMFVKAPLRRAERGLVKTSKSKTAWFWSTMWQFRGYYVEAAIATVVVNVLALATTLFTMNVYDRVVPNEAYSTLWVLALGTGGAVTLEFVIRNVRSWLVDRGGKKADLVISSMLFRRSMALRMEGKPGSAGAYANNMGSFESLREFFSSAAVIAMADLPFVVLFVAVIGMMSGILWVVPAIVIPALILVGILAQIPLRRLAQKQMEEASDRQGLLVESIDGLETLKANRGEGWMTRRWDDANAMSSKSSGKIRILTALVTSFSSYAQQATTVAIVVWGVYLINTGSLTQGGLIAATMLTGRAIGPVASIMGLAGRWQQCKTALKTLTELMERPVEREESKSYVPLPRPKGALHIKKVAFSYPQAGRKSLDGMELNVAPGQKVALIGRVGSGKSTLLRLAAGFYWGESGVVSLDGIDLRQIDPAVLRQTVGLMGQDSRLFNGTLRENLTMGNTAVSDTRIVTVLESLGLMNWVNDMESGLDSKIGEGGTGLSGGQRQLIAMARLMLSNPSVVLLDEPTSALDTETEQRVIAALKQWMGSKTLLLATHRPSLLSLADTVAVVNNGKIHSLSSKDALAEKLSQRA